jgi:hypothetical protein
MYTGRLIDELIESVERAEFGADVPLNDEITEGFVLASVLDASYTHEYAGVA